MKLLVHACCGPCSIAPIQQLQCEGINLALAFINPNIQPMEEYERRKRALLDLAAVHGWQVFETEYEPHEWERYVSLFGLHHPRARCQACYRVRLRQTAFLAAQKGYDALCTTLSVSPHQDQRAIKTELARAAEEYGLQAYYRDFSSLFEEGQHEARQMEMYMQDTCGCRFSAVEALEQRAFDARARKFDQGFAKALCRMKPSVAPSKDG